MKPSLVHACADRNLLFGILALQMNFAGRDALVAAMHAWVLDKTKPLGQILLDQGQLTPAQVAALDALIVQHLQVHGEDAERSLRSLSSASSARALLTPIEDDEVQASLAKFGAAPPADDTHPFVIPRDGTQRFRILRPHARGGLGVVWVADDTEFHREVALKEIQPERADDPISRSRFLLEAEITAQLEHPGIVPVYALGVYADGRPYYAMRFIRGDSMKQAIEQLHGGKPTEVANPAAKNGSTQMQAVRAADPFSTLDFHRLLRRFIDMCNAVGYAHSRGVLHRDLKPANVMLCKFGETLVVDWGLAKAGVKSQESGIREQESPVDIEERPLAPSSSGSVEPTQMGAALGTPAYMSPEQAAGRLDQLGPASDIYSLGATLYVLLTGKRPFQGDDIVAQVQRGQFPAPRQVKPQTPAPLDAICRKAMALQPAQRYPTALDLAAEVEHWLADGPVAAYPEPWPVRLARWARRHRTALVGAAVFLVSAVIALSVSTTLVWAEQKKTAQQKLVAEQNYHLSREQSFNIIALIESSEAEIAAVPALHKIRKEILVLASTACRKYLAEEPHDVELRRRTAQIYRYTANVHRLRNEIALAEPLYQDAARLHADLAEQFPDEFIHRQQLAETWRDHASLQSRVGRLQEATALLEQALASAEKLLDKHPEQPNLRRTAATALLALAAVQYARGRHDQAGPSASRATELFRALADQPAGPAHPYDPLLLAATLNITAINERELGHLAAAYEGHKEPIKLADELTKKLRLGLNQGDVLHFLASFRLEQSRTWAMFVDNPKRRENAEKNMSATIQQWEGLSKNYSGIPMYRDSLGFAYLIRGQFRADDAKRTDEARADLEKAQQLLEQRVQESPEMPGPRGDLGRTYLERGRLARKSNDPAAAATWFAKAAEALGKAVEQSPDHALDRRALAEARAEMGN